jgi:hypothetical protein
LPLYGPLNTVVPAAAAERWIDRLLSLKEITADAADAIAQIGARTGDPACDVSPEIVERAVARLAASHSAAVEQLQHVRPAAWRDAARVFGESLPEGLRLE